MTTILNLPFEVILKIFNQLEPLNDLESIAFIPQLRPYLGDILCLITDFNIKHLDQGTRKYDNYIVEYMGQGLQELRNVMTELRGLNHRVVSRDLVLPVGMFDNGVFNGNESGLEGIYFDQATKVGRDNWYEVFGDTYFPCKKIRFGNCKEMRIFITSKDFPVMSLECPALKKLDLKLSNGKISLEFLKKFQNLKELKIHSDGAVFGFRFLNLPNLETLVLSGQSLELGFFGCEFPKLKCLDIRRLKEALIILDTKFGPDLEELDLSQTSMTFPITLDIPSLKRLNIKNYHFDEKQSEKSLTLKLNKLENLELIELSSFNLLKHHPNLFKCLKEIRFDRDASIDRKLEYQEINELTTMRFQELESLIITINEPGSYDFFQIHEISPKLQSITLLFDGTEEQYHLTLGPNNRLINKLFSAQRKKRRSV